MENTQITSIDQLRNYSLGQVVELPAFGDGQPFVARLKRPSMLNLIKAGRIPNELLGSANSLFEKGPAGMMAVNKLDDSTTQKMFDIIDILCDASFVEPKYSDIKAAGVELTDEQYMFVFDYTQNGVKALDSFRKNG